MEVTESHILNKQKRNVLNDCYRPCGDICCTIRIPTESIGACMETNSSLDQITSNAPSLLLDSWKGERDRHTNLN